MDKISAMRVYIAVVESHGFSAASRTLGMTLPTVHRKVSELENHLDAQLLVRTTRKVTPTDSGARYYADVKRILEEIDDADSAASGEFRSPKGLLTITAPSLFGRLLVLPIVHEFMQLHEEIDVRLLFTNQVLDMTDHHIDLGFRIGQSLESPTSIKPIGAVRQVVCANHRYLTTHGRPSSPSELTHHRTITFSRSGNQVPWTFRTLSGKAQQITVKSQLVLNATDSALDCALQGKGLAQFYSYQVARSLATRDLEIVLEPFEIEPVPVSIVLSHGSRAPQKVLSFVEFAQSAIQSSDLLI